MPKYLFEYFRCADGSKRPNGWWEICDGMLVNPMGGRHRYDPAPDDRIVEADSFLDLDHSYLVEEDSEYGWVSPEGRFYGCDVRNHSYLARYLFRATEEELEEKGWAKIYMNFDRKRDWYCKKFLTEFQKATLERLGITV